MSDDFKEVVVSRINNLLQDAVNQIIKIENEVENMINSISKNFKFRVSTDIQEMIEQSEKKKLVLDYYILTLNLIIENDNFDYDFLEERYYLFYRGMAGAVYKNVSLATANAYHDVMHIVDSEKKRLKCS